MTGNEFFCTITEVILDYVVREMTDSAGGFYSTQDANSEGEEGKFFVWTPDEIREVLGDDGDDVASTFMAAYGVTRHGNFDLQDNATPSGNAMAVTTLLKLAGCTNDLRYVDIAHRALAQAQIPTSVLLR